MSLQNWLTRWSPKNVRRKISSCRLSVEALEVREVLSGFATAAPSYVLPSASGVEVRPLLTVGDEVLRTGGGAAYRMVGIPDGMGAFDNNDGTFTLLMDHELGAAAGNVRAHGSAGAFVSRWVVDKATLGILSGSDLIRSVQLFNTTTQMYVSGTTAFGRLCSADLAAPTAYFNAATGLGTAERIFMNGEEIGAEGRGFGTVVSSGIAYELPWLGKFSWENSVASPFAQNKTIVVGLDDSTPGQVYIYIGNKISSGNPVERAGLTNGNLFGIKVNGLPVESRDTPPAPGTRFSLFDLGNVSSMTGAQLDTTSRTNGVTDFLRPEDGAWDPQNPNDFYFVTTDRYDQVKDGVGTQVGRTRLYRLRFDDITRPELGGTIEAVLDGTEAGNMYDNMTIDTQGRIYIQEDVGNQAHSSKIWRYDLATDRLVEVARHNEALFGNLTLPAVSPYNQDEESSGIIDVSHILGPGKFIINVQAHYAINVTTSRGFSDPNELVEGGQLLLLDLLAPEASLTDGVLRIEGTLSNDVITVNRVGNEILVLVNDEIVNTFPVGSVSQLRIDGSEGNDTIIVAADVQTNAIITGGAGADTIVGSQLGRSLLIGGQGPDLLIGGLNSDLLIAGTTAHDNDEAALSNIMRLWSQDLPYAQRMSSLATILNSTTVFSDSSPDRVFGLTELDWFFASSEDETDRQASLGELN